MRCRRAGFVVELVRSSSLPRLKFFCLVFAFVVGAITTYVAATAYPWPSPIGIITDVIILCECNRLIVAAFPGFLEVGFPCFSIVTPSSTRRLQDGVIWVLRS